MSLVDEVLVEERWDGSKPPVGTKPTKKLFAEIIGKIRNLEVRREQEQAEFDKRYQRAMDGRANLAEKVADLQAQIYGLEARLKKHALRDVLDSIKLNKEDQRKVLTFDEKKEEEEYRGDPLNANVA